MVYQMTLGNTYTYHSHEIKLLPAGKNIMENKYFSMQIERMKKKPKNHIHQIDCKIIRLKSMMYIKHNYIQMCTLKVNIKSEFLLQ